MVPPLVWRRSEPQQTTPVAGFQEDPYAGRGARSIACQRVSSLFSLSSASPARLEIVNFNGDCKSGRQDDGAGVNADALSRLVERGKRLDESVEGYGLGLAIVRDIVDQYGGDLALGRSEVLGGFRVAVTLPLGRDDRGS